jgi:hypothetical protein
LDNTSGVCKGDATSTTCCEVPQTVTGEYFIDSRSRWNTQSNFNYNRAIYGVSMTGVTYTNEQWSELMKTIKNQMYSVGYVRGRYRDFSWNLVAWASFTALSTSSGYLQFYALGEVGVIFNRQIITMGYGSNYSVVSPCTQSSTAVYQSASRILTVTTELEKDGNCQTSASGVISCSNPCPNILAPQGFGYDPITANVPSFTWQVDMAAVSTAIAVNMGIQNINHLVQFPGDNDRIALFREMISGGYFTENQMNNTNSYFESLYAPVQPVYW